MDPSLRFGMKKNLVIRPSIPDRRRLILAVIVRPLWTLRLLLWAKHALFCPTNAPVSVQSFQHELRGGHQHLRLLFGFDAQGCELVGKSLNVAHAIEAFLRSSRVRQFEL